MSARDFTVDVFQNEYLPGGAREVNAIVTVTSAGSVADGPASPPSAAEIIIVDCSGSMGYPRAKLIKARHATAAAIDVIRDGTAFAVVAGAGRAWPLYPKGGGLAIADPRTRENAKRSVARLRLHAGTAIGQWLRLTCELFAAREDTLRHAILLTDGQNEHESAAELAAAIELCAGVFSCDCRGVGTDWHVDELRKISTALLGSVDIVPDPAGLTADFEAIMQASMAKEVADVALRVWTPQHATVRFVKQVAPAIEDLTARRAQAAPQAGDYPTGAWGTREPRLPPVRGRRAGTGRPGDARRPGQPDPQHCTGPRRRARGWSGRSGPRMRRCPPGSTVMSPITPGRPSSPRPSRTGSRPARQATTTRRPPGWAGRWRSPTSPATRTRPTCWPRWST